MINVQGKGATNIVTIVRSPSEEGPPFLENVCPPRFCYILIKLVTGCLFASLYPPPTPSCPTSRLEWLRNTFNTPQFICGGNFFCLKREIKCQRLTNSAATLNTDNFHWEIFFLCITASLPLARLRASLINSLLNQLCPPLCLVSKHQGINGRIFSFVYWFTIVRKGPLRALVPVYMRCCATGIVFTLYTLCVCRFVCI